MLATDLFRQYSEVTVKEKEETSTDFPFKKQTSIPTFVQPSSPPGDSCHSNNEAMNSDVKESCESFLSDVTGGDESLQKPTKQKDLKIDVNFLLQRFHMPSLLLDELSHNSNNLGNFVSPKLAKITEIRKHKIAEASVGKSASFIDSSQIKSVYPHQYNGSNSPKQSDDRPQDLSLAVKKQNLSGKTDQKVPFSNDGEISAKRFKYGGLPDLPPNTARSETSLKETIFSSSIQAASQGMKNNTINIISQFANH